MMEIPVPKDIREYEPTLIGPFTTRHIICIGVMIALVYGVYLLEKAFGVEDPMEFPIFLIFAIPPFLVGWFKPYGMHFEVFAQRAFRDNFIAPSKRPYRVENMWYNIIEKEDREFMECGKQASSGRKQRRKKRKKRIKMSRMAILPTAERRLPDTAAFFSKKTTS